MFKNLHVDVGYLKPVHVVSNSLSSSFTQKFKLHWSLDKGQLNHANRRLMSKRKLSFSIPYLITLCCCWFCFHLRHGLAIKASFKKTFFFVHRVDIWIAFLNVTVFGVLALVSLNLIAVNHYFSIFCGNFLEMERDTHLLRRIELYLPSKRKIFGSFLQHATNEWRIA